MIILFFNFFLGFLLNTYQYLVHFMDKLTFLNYIFKNILYLDNSIILKCLFFGRLYIYIYSISNSKMLR